jgi:hypothetical protein
MQSHEERWGIYIDFAAHVHEVLSDAQAEISEAILVDSVTPSVVDQLSLLWAKLSRNVKIFGELSAEMKTSKDITPEQVVMVDAMIKKIDASSAKTDSVLRTFFQQTGLASMLPSREASGEGLYKR